jgi:hypothetical protein
MKQPRLIFCNDALEKVQIGVTDLDEVFAGCDSTLLLLICESVWNKLRADLYLSKILMKNLINLLQVNVQLLLNQFSVI